VLFEHEISDRAEQEHVELLRFADDRRPGAARAAKS
jgi:hypothetical protein